MMYEIFKQYLEHEEKSPLTVDKYMRDMKDFLNGFIKEKLPKYYVQIRTYKKVSGKNYYSSWSSAKTVTTKK